MEGVRPVKNVRRRWQKRYGFSDRYPTVTLGLTYPGGHAVFLAVAIATHAVIGYTLGARLFDAPKAGLVGGLLADADFLFPAAFDFPLVHRGLTHTGLALAVAATLTWIVADRRAGGATAVGYASHLAVDATTPTGIPVLYPVSDAFHGVVLSGHSPTATAILWSCCLSVLWADRIAERLTAIGDVFGSSSG